MTDAFQAPKPERIAESPQLETEGLGTVKKLAILPPPAQVRHTRPVTNLGKVFGQFAELQQQIAEQVVALEDSVHHQKQDVAAAMAQLPELRERINWLIASFYEQSKKDESMREHLARHDTAIEGLVDAVRIMNEQQMRWQTAFDEVIASLVRAKTTIAKD